MNLPPFSQPDLKLIDLHTEIDGSKSYEETKYFPPGGLLYIWDDIMLITKTWAKEFIGNNKYSITIHRNYDGFPTAKVVVDDKMVACFGAVKSNSNPFSLEKIDENSI